MGVKVKNDLLKQKNLHSWYLSQKIHTQGKIHEFGVFKSQMPY